VLLFPEQKACSGLAKDSKLICESFAGNNIDSLMFHYFSIRKTNALWMVENHIWERAMRAAPTANVVLDGLLLYCLVWEIINEYFVRIIMASVTSQTEHRQSISSCLLNLYLTDCRSCPRAVFFINIPPDALAVPKKNEVGSIEIREKL